MCRHCKDIEEVMLRDRHHFEDVVKKYSTSNKKEIKLLRQSLKTCITSLGGLLALPNDKDIREEAYKVIEYCLIVLNERI